MSESEIRKQKSIAFLKSKGVPVLGTLPEIEEAADVKIRSGAEIVRRAMCLATVANAAIKNDVSVARAYVRKHDLAEHLSPKEQAFLEADEIAENAAIQFSWRIEAAIPLMWAIGVYPELWFPDDEVDVSDVIDYWIGFNHPDITRIGHRDVHEILDEADLIYRLHWAVRQAGLEGAEPPANLHPSVVRERHQALNWLINYEDGDWDDVGTDT
ncbi:DUF4272 domain-containing protein [Asticcacaulis machinosus]|uniref:DUF4272 domain-containing protein n=1 Tax=Asticcacaulis machinosus TaxID=2984211 RepID=A0ABT5HHY5_9CAUL|nr:DUF4272 domain-containing protein [Asticcacaulis machinosus]MDC7675857.1 DUF4272 domain-containing protein [Asticcacaulis machinosus]